MLVDDTANATFTPWATVSNREASVNINHFHDAHAHGHEGALGKMAYLMSTTLERELNECKGYPTAKDNHAQSEPPVEGEVNQSGEDREASSADSDSVSGDEEPESGETKSVVETCEAELFAPMASGRAPLYFKRREKLIQIF